MTRTTDVLATLILSYLGLCALIALAMGIRAILGFLIYGLRRATEELGEWQQRREALRCAICDGPGGHTKDGICHSCHSGDREHARQ